ncbi:restriction endonuclease subunit S [Crenothrix sp.]|uniref:restriction endonuclease subunit S n=1 Tax=Crenothrix sp. TaxID=3100433 RepID=UPI00374D0D18
MKQGWETKKLGEVLTIERGGSPRPIDKYMTTSPDGINWIKISDATVSDKFIYETKEKITRDGLHKTRIVNEGDFILSNSMSFGRPYIMKTTGCIHDGWLVLKENGKKIFETEFLYYLLSSPFVFQQFNSKAAGSTVRNLNIALVSSVNVPIPPLPEQQRIVAILDEAFAAIAKAKANAEQNLKNAKELFESYLQTVFSTKGEGWDERRLGESDLIEIIDGDRGKNYPTQKDFLDNGFCLFMNTKNVRPNGFEFNTTMFISEAKDKAMGKGKLKRNDVVMTTRGTIGNLGVFNDEVEYENIRINSGMLIFRPNQKQITSEYLFEILRSGIIKEQIKKHVSGAAQPQLPIKTLVNFEIPVPKLIKEQQTIVQKLNSLSAQTQKLEAIYQQHINDLEELKKSILQKAFNGELKTTTAH